MKPNRRKKLSISLGQYKACAPKYGGYFTKRFELTQEGRAEAILWLESMGVNYGDK